MAYSILKQYNIKTINNLYYSREPWLYRFKNTQKHI